MIEDLLVLGEDKPVNLALRVKGIPGAWRMNQQVKPRKLKSRERFRPFGRPAGG